MPDVSSFEIFLHLLRYIITALCSISVVFICLWICFLYYKHHGTDFQNCGEANSGDLDATITRNSNVAFVFVK